jgi:predicted RND superfamily exporter protein
MSLRRPTTQILGATLFLIVALGWVVGGLPRLSVGSGVDSFLPGDDPAVERLGELADTFGGDPAVVLVRTPGASPLDEEHLPKLLRLEGTLAGLPDVAVAYGPATTLNQTVIRIQQLLAEISGRRDALRSNASPAAAERFERRYGALVVRGLPGGLPTLRNQKFVQQVVFGEDDLAEPRWAHFVPSPDTVAVFVRPGKDLDQDAASRLTDAIEAAVDDAALGSASVTITGAPVVTAELAEQGRYELPRLGAGALIAVAAALLLVPWAARRRRRLLPLVPMGLATLMTLAWFGWSGEPVSLGAVAFLPVILGVGSYYPVYLAQTGHRRLVLAVAAAAAAAFGTLALSPLPFVHDLGVTIAVGIGLVVLCSLALAPLLRVGAPAPVRATPVPKTATGGRSVWRLTALGSLAVVAAVGWAVLPNVRVETDPQRLIAGLDAFDRAEEVESQLGFSGELDIVLTGPDVLSPEALTWLRRAEEEVVRANGDQVRPIVSAPDLLAFLGPSPTVQQIEAAMRLLPSYLSGAAVSSDRSQALISLGGEWEALSSDPELLSSIEESLPTPPPGYDATVTGLPVAAARGYDLVSDSRYPANLIGIGAAVLVLLLALRRRRDAVAAAAAAVLATGAGVFVAWAFGFALNPLSLALGPLTAAAGCEFAVLLAEARRTGDAVLRRSVFLAAGLSSAGYGVLMLSELPVVRDFGLALVASLGLALISALVVVGTTATTRHDTRHALPVSLPKLETAGV